MVRVGDYARQIHIAEKIDCSTRPWRIRERVKEGKFMAEEEGVGGRTHSQQFEFADGLGVSDLGRAGPWWCVLSAPLYRLRDVSLTSASGDWSAGDSKSLC
jgi:hypothetical protein